MNIEDNMEDQTFEEVQEVYDSAPIEVKNFLDSLEVNENYQTLESVKNQLDSLGYLMDYDLMGEVTKLKKVV